VKAFIVVCSSANGEVVARSVSEVGSAVLVTKSTDHEQGVENALSTRTPRLVTSADKTFPIESLRELVVGNEHNPAGNTLWDGICEIQAVQLIVDACWRVDASIEDCEFAVLHCAGKNERWRANAVYVTCLSPWYDAVRDT